MNMDTYTFRSRVEEYTEKASKDLEDVRKINDLDKQCGKISFDLWDHERNFNELKQGKPEEYIDNYYPWKGKYSLNNYEKEIKKLKDFESELLQKSGKIREQKQKEQQNKEWELKTSRCSYCKSKPPANHYIYSTKNKELKKRKRNAYLYKKEHLFCSETHFEKWHQKNYYCCVECLEENYTSKYKYNKKQKANQKFCSDNCYYQHYAETCDNCLEKCVSNYQGKATGLAQTYYSDAENKTGTLCSKCHQEKLKEETEEKKKDKEWEESFKRLDKATDDLVEGMGEAVESKEGLDNSDIDNSDSDISNTRESKNIMKLQSDITNLENKPNKTKEEQALLEEKKKELEELLRRKNNSNISNSKPSDKTGLYIGCGVVGIVLILGLFILVRTRKRPNRA